MRTVHHIVNKSLKVLQFLRVGAERLEDHETIRLFDTTILEMSEKLRALGTLEVFAEKQTAAATGLHFD